MKYGWNLVITGILAACLLGCSVSRSGNIHDSGKTDEQVHYEHIYARNDAQLSVSNTVIDRFRNVRIHWRTYDTDKPADENGRYPVKAEGWSEGCEQESVDEDKKTTENSTENVQATTEKKKVDSFVKEEHKDVDVKAGTQPLWWWLIGLLSAMVGIIFIYWKYGKKNKTK
ncbi:hypothetical protein DW103_07390 [Parabacteroides sp. AM08-6]|nr:hypothetical protein DW103_07390 [Parabacteroides sp. AM08-6]